MAKLLQLLTLLLGVASSVPTASRNEHAEHHERRQTVLGGTLGTLEGVLGANQTFDYVIIGAGTAGLAMANRLSQDGRYTVAVIEEGTFYEVTDPLLAQFPGGDVVFVGAGARDVNTAVDWNMFTTPQSGCNDRTIHYTRGKCLGGSSARNFMIYQRPSRGSLQMWADQVDDQSFTFDNTMPYYQKSVQFTPPNTAKRLPNATALYKEDAFSPTGGPLHVSYANTPESFDSYLEPAFNQIGLPTAQDFNSGTLDGVQYCASTIDPSTGIRASSQETFLADAMGRTNLKVFQLSMAKQVLFDENKKAIGVRVEAANVAPYYLSARREVIVSAGAFHSPQMLMVSGIGPASTLQPLGIPVLVDNPNVGQNMWDHVFAGPSYRVNLVTLTRIANDLAYLLEQAGIFAANQTGALTSPVADFLGWERVPSEYRANYSASALSDIDSFPADWPDLEYISGAGYVGQFDDLLLDQPKDGYQYATILSTLVKPLSRGNVTITSADSNVLPIISPNWLTHPTDQQNAITAFKRAREAFHAPALQEVVIGDEYFPGPDTITDEQILANYANTLLTVWHASSTCAMGTGISSGAVVDSHARVFGVQGLRVVDASAFPFLPPGHPQSTIYMLAEKVAAQILAGE